MDVKRFPYLVVIIGITAASFAAIFIKIADDAPALVIAAYRLIIATLIMTPFSLKPGIKALRHYSARDIRLNIYSGIALALHFAAWIGSLKYTTVARSVILVATNPFFVSILGRIFLKERMKFTTIMGIIISIAGITLMRVWDTGIESGNIVGDLLALAGAFFAAVYFLFGRHLRQTVSTTAYAYITYTISAVVLIVFVVIAGHSWTGYLPLSYLMFVLLAVVPQIIGHTAFNFALKYLPAVSVAIVILGEPVGASLLAWGILGEAVGPATVIGGGIVLLGVFVAIYSQEKARQSGINAKQFEM
jgi:drug/metabolite transporter (DMT)-like permease